MLEESRKALYEHIADKLEDMILNDSSQVDQKLPSEQVLSAGFGVSRPVIREALKLLKERGLITQHQGSSTIVCQPGAEQLSNPMYRMVQLKNIEALHVFEIRLALETLASFTAAEHATEANLDELRRINREMEQTEDADEKTRLDVLFHKQVAKMGGNELLVVFIESLGNLLEQMMHTALLVSEETDGCRYHEKLIRAFMLHAPQKAETIMREHITLSMRNYEVAAQKNKETRKEIG